MQKNKVIFKHITPPHICNGWAVVFVCCLWLALGGGQRALGQGTIDGSYKIAYQGGDLSMPTCLGDGSEPCNLVCNPSVNDADCPDGVVPNHVLFGCSDFDGWRPAHATPDYFTGAPTNFTTLAPVDAPTMLGMRTYGPPVYPCTGDAYSEMIQGLVNVQANQKYLFSLFRALAPHEGEAWGGGATDTQLDKLGVFLSNETLYETYDQSVECQSFPPNQTADRWDIYEELNLLDNGWKQGISCFTIPAAANAYNRIVLYGNEEFGNMYTLLDRIDIIADNFPLGNHNLNLACQTTALIGDTETCGHIPNLKYQWQQSTDGVIYSDIVGATQQTYTVTATNQDGCVWYKLKRFMNTTNPNYPLANATQANCVQAEAIYKVCINGCCVINSLYANAPNTPIDDRPAYVVTNSATWTLANNPFVNLYGWTPNTPVALNVDLVIPYGVTLQLQGMQFNFAPQCRVLVQRGGVLIADVGEVSTITSFTGICNTMWQGIQIEGDTNSHRHITPSINYGVAQLRGNVFIDDALVAIACQRIPLMPVNTLFTALAASPTNFQNINNSVGAELFYTQYFNLGGAYYGGVCQISKQTVIRNSFVGVLLNRYHWNNDLPSCSMEGAAVFSTTGLKYPFTALPYSYNTETGVLLNDYWHMCVGPCTAEATVLDGNLFANNKIALRAIASTYNRFFENTVGQSRIGVSVTNTAISGFAFDLNVRLNQFQETERGIQADGSLINIRQNNLFNTTTPTNSIGVFLNGCDFDVRENDFTNFTFGNILNQNNTEPSRVLNNIFTNTTTGVWAVGNNGNIADGGTQIQCNQFNNHLSTAIRVANAIVPPTPGTMDNQGDCSFNNGTPADNTFTDTAPTDLHSMINPASFVYYYRTTNPIFLPASTAAPGFQVINTVGCAGVISSSNEHCNYIAPIPEGLVLSLTDTKQKNAKGSDLRYQYLDGQEDPTAAKNLFEAMDTRYTQSRLIPYYLGQGDFETALNLLTNLPNTDEYADLKTLYTLYYNLNSHGKTLWDINPTEEALLRQLADSPSKTSFNARAALLMLYGEEYSITLPALDNTTEPFNIGFKTNSADEQQPWVTLSPNPAKDAVQIQHHLADNQTGKFCLYSPDGHLLHSATLVGNGNYVLSTQNMASGVYFYTLEQNGQTLQRNKIVLIK